MNEFSDIKPLTQSKMDCSIGEGETVEATGILRLRQKSGNASYADLITRAINSTDQARMTLSEIYDWMVSNVAGLKDQRYLHSSKGWKNAVRHTLSINPRFKRVPRVGRPSWWTVDMDAVNHHKLQTSVNVTPVASPVSFQLEKFRERSSTEPSFLLSEMKQTKPVKRRNTSGSKKTGNSDVKATVQNVKVKHFDGTLKNVLIPKPINLKCKLTDDASTQTDIQLGFAQTPGSTYCSPTSDSQFFSMPYQLPDDLSDVSVDNSLNCDIFEILNMDTNKVMNPLICM